MTFVIEQSTTGFTKAQPIVINNNKHFVKSRVYSKLYIFIANNNIFYLNKIKEVRNKKKKNVIEKDFFRGIAYHTA